MAPLFGRGMAACGRRAERLFGPWRSGTTRLSCLHREEGSARAGRSPRVRHGGDHLEDRSHAASSHGQVETGSPSRVQGKHAGRSLSLSQLYSARGGDPPHGIEIVGQYFDAQADEVEAAFNLRDSRSEQNFYTVHNMVEVLKWFCGSSEVELASISDGFARMLAFDALVGAPDRHALNWGVVVSLSDRTLPRRFAPVFDTARGLFREHSDKKLAEIAAMDRQAEHIRSYAEKSRPVFGTASLSPGGVRCNHFELVECALRELPDELGHSIRRFINAVHLPRIEAMISKRFRRVISPLRISFLLGLLRYRYSRLKLLADGTTS